MVIDTIIDPSIVASQSPLYFAAGMLWVKMRRYDAVARAVERCHNCGEKIEVSQ